MKLQNQNQDQESPRKSFNPMGVRATEKVCREAESHDVTREFRIRGELIPFAVFFDNPDYPEQPGTVRCCGALLVVQRNGILCCDVCGVKHARTW